MENFIKEPTHSFLIPHFSSGVVDGDRPAPLIKMAAAKKPVEKTEEPKKNIWASALFGLATGLLTFFINVLPEKIGKFLSHVFGSMVKAENPFLKEAD
jgi:hypothetical protein